MSPAKRPQHARNQFSRNISKTIENQQKCLNWTPSHAGILKKHQQNKANAKTVPTTFWIQIWEPEMDFDDDFNHVAQTLQISMCRKGTEVGFVGVDLSHFIFCCREANSTSLEASVGFCVECRFHAVWRFFELNCCCVWLSLSFFLYCATSQPV